MDNFLTRWHEAAMTSAGFFWTALWAFALGYLISSLIQVLVTHQRMQDTMGTTGPRSMALATFFGFISSSCSFAALSTTRALFQKGAGLAPALAFMLASTNLVIELGIVIAIFLSWHFVVGEYLGGLLLVVFTWLFIRITRPVKLIKQARTRLEEDFAEESESPGNWRYKITSLEGWQEIGQKYVMEWQMVWKDVIIGFTAAGIISAFVPDSFFQFLFLGSGEANATNPGFWPVLAQTLVGPVAAFFTFIGSMGNIPLASLLFDHGVSFAGVMAFIFSDLVVLPVLRINASYYGWKMALYILLLLLAGLIITSLILHYGFFWLGLSPQNVSGSSIASQDPFELDYRFVLNLVFLSVSALLGRLWWQTRSGEHHHHHGSGSLSGRVIKLLAGIAIIWLLFGITLAPLLSH